MAKIIIKNGVITTKQKIGFFKYALKKLKQGFPYGFCVLYNDYFDESSNELKLLPELLHYKPKKKFYNVNNEQSIFPDQFWFPLRGDNKERIEICKIIIKNLNNDNKI